MTFTVLTLFPEMLSPFFQESILKRAQDSSSIKINIVNIREYTKNKHKRVDDTPYGGGAGMLLSCQPLFDCIEDRKKKAKKNHIVVYMSPQGNKLSQFKVEQFSKKYEEIIILCGHYEGIDERVKDALIDIEVSIGDYVLSGGEIPAAVLIDSISRLIPGVLGKEASHEEESFSKALKRKKEYPHYTRPSDFRGMKVPEVLLSGNHKDIQKWRVNHSY
ncbi:tRNA (guanosine(37)-N1)-methyltransferase TrmD [Candidatus Peregrinibacteria bacterium]|jgi:tRNA (guanine37-N1)-methyltransferase|nr:tRNA (guanosine(37)-N1)-methyltransferase TrmD [Candidatus Peregrinibacteria bacterium]